MILFLWKERNTQTGMLLILVLYSDSAFLSNIGGFTPLFISPPGRGGYPCFPMPLAYPLLRSYSSSLGCVTQLCYPSVCWYRGHGIHQQPGFGSLSLSPLLPSSSLWVTSASAGWPLDALSCLLLDQVVSILCFYFPLSIYVLGSTMGLITGSFNRL